MDGYHPDALGDRFRRVTHDTPTSGIPVTISFRACTAARKGAGAVRNHRTAKLVVERGQAYAGGSMTMAREMALALALALVLAPLLTPTPTLTPTLTRVRRLALTRVRRLAPSYRTSTGPRPATICAPPSSTTSPTSTTSSPRKVCPAAASLEPSSHSPVSK